VKYCCSKNYSNPQVSKVLIIHPKCKRYTSLSIVNSYELSSTSRIRACVHKKKTEHMGIDYVIPALLILLLEEDVSHHCGRED
jgi:hypothetical protein